MKGICITIHHEGTFTYDPLSYECGDVEVVENVDLGNTSYERLLEICKECCLFPVHGMYFCAPKVDIGKHLKPLRNDSELANFVKLSYDNGCKVELYVEHHGYNILDGVTEEVVDEELDDEIEIKDVSEFVGLDHVGEEDVELPNTGLNDTFLTMLVDGKFIRDKDFGAKVDTQSSSSRNVDDNSVDNKFKVKEGFSYPVFNPNLPWNEMAPLLGMKFEHPDQLKDCLINYGVANGYQLWYKRNDYRHISVQCGKNVKECRCSSQKGKQKVVEDIRTQDGCKCRRAKYRVVYDLKGGLIDHYAKLWDYRDEILSMNPGSTVQLDVDTLDDGKTQFKRMYICFKAMKEGCISCRRVIGLDDCFLKSTCRGELLTAMGRDSNKQMFPMAWAVVSNENSKNWLWFLSNLGSDFNLAMGAYLTILSDGHKGLIEAVKELLPHAEHRLCARHIYVNFKKKWNGLHYKSLFWGAAASTLESFFQMDRSCAAFENGISESYHSAIGIARTKPIISMLEEIRVYLMQRIVAMNQKAVNLNDIICPAIRKELEKLKKYQRYWQVVPCGQQLFEVRKADEGFGVNLNTKTCTCKRWNLSGMPCIHAVAAYCMLNQDPGKGVSSWYSKQMWVDVYSNFIKLVGGSSIWVKSANPPPLPPKKRIMPGRPRKNRIKHVTEGVNQLSRSDRYMTCSNCWEKCHNKAKCYNQTRPKPQQEKRKLGRKSQQAANQPFNPPSAADPSSADPSAADPSSADLSAADSTFADPNQTFTGLLNCVEQQSMGAEITDAEIAALADMNEVEEREARRKDVERVLEEEKKKGVYRKRCAGGWRGPSERITNQRRKKDDHNGPGKKPDTTLDVSD
ncbi:hypothetical protein Tco_0858367 [Tanacetum coccineum]|uniref:SWIM-type domain-containing protein n=1 Tax=Tanacetum coccineum TaxID=301880 RepID=A0ABQ5B8Y0_9ASTR